MSGLDSRGGQFFVAFRAARDRALGAEGIDRFCGVDVERWILKWLCGDLAMSKSSVPEQWVRILFGRGDVVDPSGLHFNVRVGDDMLSMAAQGALSIELASNREGAAVGCRIRLLGHVMNLGLDGRRVSDADDLGKLSVLRPAYVRWTNAGTAASYTPAFEWPSNVVRDGIDVRVSAP